MGLHRVVPSAPALHGNGGHGFADAPGASGLGLARGRYSLGSMVGRSSAMERLFLQIRYLAGHVRLALFEGERGTGKRLAARTLHELSPHRAGPFTAHAAQEALAGDLPALLREAGGGTLYLAGVDGLSLDQQARLLHLLGWLGQGGTARTAGARPGSQRDLPQVSLPGEAPRAVLLSTVRALRPLVLYGKFRADLQRELGSVHLALPPLRERREDIPVLLEHFLKRHSPTAGARRLRGYAPDLLPALLAPSWPGNVAEFEAALAAAARRSTGEWLRAHDLYETGPHGTSLQEIDLRGADLHGTDLHGRALSGTGPSGTALPGAASGRSAFGLSASGGRRPSAWSAASGQARSVEVSHLQHAGIRLGASAAYSRTPAARPGPSGGGPHEPDLFDPNLDRAILRHIRRVLATVNGNKLRAARLLGISRSTLYRLLESEAARQTEAASDSAV